MGRDPYEFLGVHPSASIDEIKAAWREVSKVVHPDLAGTADDFREAFDAYRLLVHRDLRASAENKERGIPGTTGGRKLLVAAPALDI